MQIYENTNKNVLFAFSHYSRSFAYSYHICYHYYMSVIFDEQFWQDLRDRFKNFAGFISINWFWGVIILVIIAIFAFLQQILIILTSGALLW